MGSLGRAFLSQTRRRASLSLVSFPTYSSNPSFSLSRNPDFLRHGLLKTWINNVKSAEQFHMNRLHPNFMMERKFLRNFSSLGKNFGCYVNGRGMGMCKRMLIGMSAVAGTMAMWAADVYAMDGRDILVEHHREPGEPSGFLKEDLYNFWTLAKRFQLPAVLLLMVLLGWRHPFTLVVNIILLLSCTRPSPYSVYIFIEQLRKRAMQQDPGLSKSKLFYARKVDVQDYKLLCTAKVELRDRKLRLIGILGSWWIFQSWRM